MCLTRSERSRSSFEGQNRADALLCVNFPTRHSRLSGVHPDCSTGRSYRPWPVSPAQTTTPTTTYKNPLLPGRFSPHWRPGFTRSDTHRPRGAISTRESWPSTVPSDPHGKTGRLQYNQIGTEPSSPTGEHGSTTRLGPVSISRPMLHRRAIDADVRSLFGRVSGDRTFTVAERRLAQSIAADLERVERGLVEEVRFTAHIAEASTRYLLEAGGKRLRPTLLLLTSHLGSGATDDVITAAEAIEITHLASLYHDDVMDGSDRRRGIPSAHSVWGNQVAILTGDLLFARASQLMARLGERAIRIQTDTFERLVLGQLNETVGPREGDDPIAHYLNVLADKTGSLLAAAAQAGVMFSGGPAEHEQPIIDFAERIGAPFQILDDVLDLSAQPEKTGKVPGTDLRSGVVTLPLLRLRDMAIQDASSADLLERLERVVLPRDGGDDGGTGTGYPTGGMMPPHTDRELQRQPPSRAVDALVAEFRAHPPPAATIAEAHGWLRSAVAALEPLPDSTVKATLAQFADAMVQRSTYTATRTCSPPVEIIHRHG